MGIAFAAMIAFIAAGFLYLQFPLPGALYLLLAVASFAVFGIALYLDDHPRRAAR